MTPDPDPIAAEAALARGVIAKDAVEAAKAIEREARIAALERDNVGRRVYDRLNGVEAAIAVQHERLDDHDVVLVDIRDHLKELSAAVQNWDKKFYALLAVLLAGSPGLKAVVSALIG